MSKAEGKKIGISFTENLVGDVSGLTPIPVGYKAGVNDLAQGKVVTAGNVSYGAVANAVDGNNSTYWGATGTSNMWIVIDFGEVKKTAGFYIMQSNSSYRGRAYTIQGSNDNAVWAAISSGELANTAEQTIEYPASDYRYIRFAVTSYWSSSRIYVYTLKILEAAPVGNEIAFIVSGKEYLWVNGPDNNGPLINKTYKPISVEEHPTISKAILLTFPTFEEFRSVVGELTVEYNANIGNLSGRGGRVESFTAEFSPLGLEATPNPGITENVTVAPGALVLDFVELEYFPAIAEENISVAPGAIGLDLIYVGVINP